MRVARSGGWTSATSPASKRSRRRSSSACRSRGGRSEVTTIWRPPSCSALNVWKNSSSVLVLRCEELDVVEQQHVDVAEAGLEGVGAPTAERVEEVVGEGLAGGAADGQAGAVREQQVGDRAEQVGLADAGRTADEQRVVGLRGHLGDGQRRGVRKPVAVADDELLECQLGVAERPAPRVARRRRFQPPARSPPPGVREPARRSSGARDAARWASRRAQPRRCVRRSPRGPRRRAPWRRRSRARGRSDRASSPRRAAGLATSTAHRQASAGATAAARCDTWRRPPTAPAPPVSETICAPAPRSRQR